MPTLLPPLLWCPARIRGSLLRDVAAVRIERRLRILAMLERAGLPLRDTAPLCQVGVELTETTGAGIMLFDQGVSRGSLCTTDEVSALLEMLQFTLGEGPGLDACREGRPILEPGLAAPAIARWIAFAPPALEVGVRAVFGFPLRIGVTELGALHLYRDRAGPLSDEQYADALVLADLAAETILLMQADASPGELAIELQRGASFHYVVHQASGMVSAQLELSVDHAMVRLRAHAFRTGVPLLDVARAVVSRTLRFAPDPDDELDAGQATEGAE